MQRKPPQTFPVSLVLATFVKFIRVTPAPAVNSQVEFYQGYGESYSKPTEDRLYPHSDAHESISREEIKGMGDYRS